MGRKIIKHKKVTISLNQTPATEANSGSAKAEIPQNLMKPEVHYHFQKSSKPFLLSAR
jgi:hypothetical protein